MSGGKSRPLSPPSSQLFLHLIELSYTYVLCINGIERVSYSMLYCILSVRVMA